MTGISLRVQRTKGVLRMTTEEFYAELKKPIATLRVCTATLNAPGALLMLQHKQAAKVADPKAIGEAERDLVQTILHILPKLTPNNLSAVLLEAERLEALADA